MQTRGFLTTAALPALAAAVAGVSLAQQELPLRAGSSCSPAATSSAPRLRGLVPMHVESHAFPDGGIVPFNHSFASGGTQPDFKITGAPNDTQSFAIILHDIDVAIGGPDGVLHRIAWNIPGNRSGARIYDHNMTCGRRCLTRRAAAHPEGMQ